MDKIMDLLNESEFAAFGRDFVGGIDNEALDFGQLDSFVHLPNNSSSPNVNSSTITLAVTAITAINTTPAQTIITTTASGSVASATAPAHGTLPESPPDSGSEPPYSPTDLHAINPMAYHHFTHQQHPANTQPMNPHQLEHALHMTDSQSLMNANNGSSTSSIHKTGDILLSSATMQLPNAATMMMSNNDMMIHQNAQNLLGLGIQTSMNMGRSNIYRNESNNLLPLSSDEDFSCLITDPMFQTPPNGMNGHQSHQQTQQSPVQHSNAYNPQILPQMSTIPPPQVVSVPHSADPPHLLNTRKRTIDSVTPQNGNSIPIKRSSSVILPSIKPEPDALSPACVSALIEPATPPAALDVCSSISSCSGSSTSPASTTIVMSNIESNASPSIQQQQQQQANNGDNVSNDSYPMPCIRFSPFQQQNWHILCDQSLQEIPLPHYRVDADKGFNFSTSDDAFVCQKKNHFQVTCHAQLQGSPASFVRTEGGLEKIKSFHIHFYGVKLETPTQSIRIEQSQSDRSKKPFHPVPIDLQQRQVSKVTVGRLHFSETTSNNMRKKGRPNPEQRYFQLVVGLHAHTHSGDFPVISHGSERIIVRASNPGQFESDVELCWQRGVTQDSIFTHAGRVGINTDRPDESLVVHGNLKISGHIVQPSDGRAKHEIGELDTSQQLQNVRKIRLVKYRYDPGFAMDHGLTNLPTVHTTKSTKGDEHHDKSNTKLEEVVDIIDTGVIAQEIREVLPDAVQEAGSVLLSNGNVIPNFLVVNKDRIYMENIGAVKELCNITGSLESRIAQLERVHIPKSNEHKCKFNQCDDDPMEPCSNKMIQITIIVLVIIMAICLAAISTLYFVEHRQNERHHNFMASTFSNDNRFMGDRFKNINSWHNWRGNETFLNDGKNIENLENIKPQKNTKPDPDRRSNLTKPMPQNTRKLNITKSDTRLMSSSTEKNGEFEYIITTNETSQDGIVTKQAKTTLNKYGNEVTTEKLKAEIIVDTYQPKPEPHDPIATNTIPDNGYSMNDVDTNFIDDSQPNARNNSKTEQKNSSKIRSNEADIRHSQREIVFESEYHRERKIRLPIGIPAHCMMFLQASSFAQTQFNGSAESGAIPTDAIPLKTNKTEADLASHCPSFCVVATGKVNHVSDLSEVPELVLPVDVVETSTAFKPHKTSTMKSVPVEETASEVSVLRESLSQTSTANEKITSFESSTQAPSSVAMKTFHGVNANVEQPEQPIEVPSPITQNTPAPIASVMDLPQNKSFEINVELKQTEVEPQPLPHSQNDIKTTFNEKLPAETNFEKPLGEQESIEASVKSSGINQESGVSQVRSMSTPTTTSTTSFAVPAGTANSPCLLIHLLIRSESFNITLGTDEICHNSNITYNIPLSKYMKESRFELIFVTTNTLQWTLCSMKEGTGKESHSQLDGHNVNDESVLYTKGMGSHAAFDIDIPIFGDFERQMEFQANLPSSGSNGCRLPTSSNSNSMQTVQYKINIYRDYTQ